MTTEDRLRELAPHGMTRLLLKASPKRRRRHHKGGGGRGVRNEVIQESIEILTLYLHAFII